jgi:hypothetical protein
MDRISSRSRVLKGALPMNARTSLLVLAVLAVSRPAIAQQATRTASIPYVTLQVKLLYDYQGAPILEETYTTNDPHKHSVYCMSGFYDARYTLRDSSGHVIPINTEPWKFGSDIISGGGGVVPGAGDPCKTVKAPRDERRFPLAYLYPNLKRGAYTLQITLAPQGQSAYAALAPITVKIH